MKHPAVATPRVSTLLLGQAGVRLVMGDQVILIDPYLSDRVAELYGSQLRRLRPPPFQPAEATDVDWILITHAHEDHCDPATLLPMLQASPGAKVLCSAPAADLLVGTGIDNRRLIVAEEDWFELERGVRVRPVPAAHPDVVRSADGRLHFVGYIVEWNGRRIYHAGDTAPADEIFSAFEDLPRPDVAFLPVNERNYFRDRAGIVGNMSVREAFAFAERIGVECVVPIHWDLFAPNTVFREEIELLYDRLRPSFRLLLSPFEI